MEKISARHAARHARLRIRCLLVTLGISFIIGSGFAQNIGVTSGNGIDYTINGQNDPPLALQRGVLYVFTVTTPGHPFYIKTTFSTGTGSQYTSGVTNNGASNGNGTLYFNVPLDAPDHLFYHCAIHFGMGGDINIVDPPSPPTVRVVFILVSDNIVIHSTGTNGWNAVPEFNCDLSGTNWMTVPSFTNSFANGTNTTTFDRLDAICGSPSVLIRIRNEQE